MSGLTDADLDRAYAAAPLLPPPGGEVVRQLIDSLREERRARVVGGTDGPDQGDPAAWAVIHDNGRWGFWCREDDAVDAASVDDLEVVPLYRAPGAVAAAPPGDEAVLPYYEVRDIAREAERASVEEVESLAREVLRLRVAPAPPTGHGAVAAAPSGDGAQKARPRVSDDDLDYMRRWASMSDPARNGTADYESALAELHQRRAADAAAAPPGDEDEARTVGALARAEALAAGDPEWMNVTRWPRDVAPPAGHEDEAAVERADLARLAEKWAASDDDRWVRLSEDLRDLFDPVAVEDCPRCTPDRVERERGPGYCDEQGPWGERCTDDAGHWYSHQSNDSSFQDDWRRNCAATGHVRSAAAARGPRTPDPGAGA